MGMGKSRGRGGGGVRLLIGNGSSERRPDGLGLDAGGDVLGRDPRKNGEDGFGFDTDSLFGDTLFTAISLLD